MHLFYKKVGKGLPVMLLHGFPFDHTLWDQVVSLLSQNITIIMPDLQGFGKSALVNDNLSLRDLAEDVIALMNTLSIDEAVIFGHSMGGYVALEIARQKPEKLLGLGLIASHIFGDSQEKREARINTVALIKQNGVENALRGMPAKLSDDRESQVYGKKAIREVSDKTAITLMIAMAHRQAAEDIWKGTDCPKCIIAGRDDQFVTVKMSEQMAAASSEIYYSIIPNAGHMPMLEQPKLTAAAMSEFIDSIR